MEDVDLLLEELLVAYKRGVLTLLDVVKTTKKILDCERAPSPSARREEELREVVNELEKAREFLSNEVSRLKTARSELEKRIKELENKVLELEALAMPGGRDDSLKAVVTTTMRPKFIKCPCGSRAFFISAPWEAIIVCFSEGYREVQPFTEEWEQVMDQVS